MPDGGGGSSSSIAGPGSEWAEKAPPTATPPVTRLPLWGPKLINKQHITHTFETETNSPSKVKK